MSGQDILDQAAGTTAFVRNYLHITWDGSETQNDKATASVHGVAGSLSDGLAAIPLDHSVLGANFEDQITPNGDATAIFTDDAAKPNALSRSGARPHPIAWCSSHSRSRRTARPQPRRI